MKLCAAVVVNYVGCLQYNSKYYFKLFKLLQNYNFSPDDDFSGGIMVSWTEERDNLYPDLTIIIKLIPIFWCWMVHYVVTALSTCSIQTLEVAS